VKTIEHVGTVVDVDDQSAHVELEAGAACPSPLHCSCCGVGQTGPRRLRVPRGGLEQGDRVSVTLPVYAGYVSALVVFALPVVLFLVGAGVGWFLAGQEGGSDAPVVVGGLCGFGLAVVVAVVVNRHMGAGRVLQVRRLEQPRS
jgi:positive regulator of sigma E activity